MDGIETNAEFRCYQELAVKIVEVACADYIDALIIKRQGYVSEEKYRERLFNKALSYGRRRYVWRDSRGLHVQKNGHNLLRCKELRKLIDNKENIERAKSDVIQLEKFFRGSQFAIFMPNTDPDGLIRLLKMRALRGERMATGYGSNY